MLICNGNNLIEYYLYLNIIYNIIKYELKIRKFIIFYKSLPKVLDREYNAKLEIK